MAEHSLLDRVIHLTTLVRNGDTFSVEAVRTIVDILKLLTDDCPESLQMTAGESKELSTAVDELAVVANLPQPLRRRPGRPSGPPEAGGEVLQARGALLAVLIQMIGTWASDPENQQKFLDWLFSMFGGGASLEGE